MRLLSLFLNIPSPPPSSLSFSLYLPFPFPLSSGSRSLAAPPPCSLVLMDTMATPLWLCEEGGGWWFKLEEWQVKLFEEALQKGHDVAQYDWDPPEPRLGGDDEPRTTRYFIDLTTMTQTNKRTGKVRRLVRIPPDQGFRTMDLDNL